jgi:hypothetical protein
MYQWYLCGRGGENLCSLQELLPLVRAKLGNIPDDDLSILGVTYVASSARDPNASATAALKFDLTNEEWPPKKQWDKCRLMWDMLRLQAKRRPLGNHNT